MMNKKSRTRLTAILMAVTIISPMQVHSEEEPSMITMTRTVTPLREIAGSVTIIDAKEIEAKQKNSVVELLRDVPSIDIVQNGGAGGTASIFIRGARSEQTLVLMDGVELNDPSSPSRAYNFANFGTNNIERIEIIRGPQSTMYGSDAIGGVINIITKRGSGAPQLDIAGEGGSYKTFTENASVRGGSPLVNYSLSGQHTASDGFSAANKKDGNTEKDGYEITNASARLGLTPHQNFDLDLITRYIKNKSDLDNAGGVGGDDSNYYSDNEELFFRTQAGLKLFNNFWTQTAGASYTNHNRSLINSTDPDHPLSSSDSEFLGQVLKADWQNNFQLRKTNLLTVGVETQEETAKSKTSSTSTFGPFLSEFSKQEADTDSIFVQDQFNIGESFYATAGLRVDDHSRFGSEDTHRLTGAYLINQTGTKFKSTYGTGFKAPSLYQLFSSFGDLELNPETSTGWDFGVEQFVFGDAVMIGATYFDNEFKNLIDFDSASLTYKNISEADSKGLELVFSYAILNNLNLSANHTLTDTEDKATGLELVRRPRNKTNVNLNYSYRDRANAFIQFMAVGERDDYDFTAYPAARVTLDSYTLVNCGVAHPLTKSIQVFARVENLFDEDYEEVKGFGTPGVSGYAGLNLSFREEN